MKIVDVEPILLQAPQKQGERAPVSYTRSPELGRKIFGGYRALLVRITTDTGLVGIGECLASLAPAATAIIVRELRHVLLEKDPTNIQPLWDDMFSTMRQRGHTKGFMIEAMSGIDIALWDILGKTANLPIYKLLGGKYRDKLPAYAASLRDDNVEQAVTLARRCVSEGFGAIKIKVSNNVKKATQALEMIREAVGNDVQVMVDANCGYSLKPAMKLGRVLEKHEVYWFEEPFLPDNLEDYLQLKKVLGVRIAAGESEYTRHGFKQLIMNKAVDVAQFSIDRGGGISEAKRVFDMATAFNLECSPHTGTSSAVCMAASIQMAAAIQDFGFYEYMILDRYVEMPNPFKDRILREPIEELQGGQISIRDRPGLGIDVDDKMIQTFRV